jgi:serine/threonine-protein kinase
MAITDVFLLPRDVLIIPVAELPAQARANLEFDEGDFAVTRPLARHPSKIIDAPGAALLDAFRSPKTIVEAIVDYSRQKKVDPEQTLVEALPLLQRFIRARFLVPPDAADAEVIAPTCVVGSTLVDFEILDVVQVYEDTELYRARSIEGCEVALKITRPRCSEETKNALDREATILRLLEGRDAPELVRSGSLDDRRYLAIAWCAGENAATSAARLRATGDRSALLSLCVRIADAYRRLHARALLHGDVHPRNVIVGLRDDLWLVDFGLACVKDDHPPKRGGIAYFFEPELVRARRSNQEPPRASAAGEQYAVAALIYFLIAGAHTLDFSPMESEMLRQIVEDPPLSFSAAGAPAWPSLEAVLGRALSKQAPDRFASMDDFVAALRNVDLRSDVHDERVTPATLRSCNRHERLERRLLDRVGAWDSEDLTAPPTRSLCFGAAGIAYTLYRWACARSDARLASLADLWATKAIVPGGPEGWYQPASGIRAEEVGTTSLQHCVAGAQVVRALVSQSLGDVGARNLAVSAFVEATRDARHDDLVLGSAGTLLGCALLREAIGAHDANDGHARRTLEALWAKLGERPSITESEGAVLGVAHGWAGFLFASLRWCRASGDAFPAALEERLQQLALCAKRLDDGVWWPRRHREITSARDLDFAASWCNGAAGHVMLWTLASKTWKRSAHLELAERAARTVCNAPNAAFDLCCGDAGRASALLALHAITESASLLRRAHDLVHAAIESFDRRGGLVTSLYKGGAGIALVASEIDAPRRACFPMFGEEGWPLRG